MADYLPKPFADLANWWTPIDSYTPPTMPTSAPNRLLTGAWRMPYFNALLGLATGCQADPAINRSVFPNTSTWWFWSGSPDADFSDFAWSVHFSNGDTYSYITRDGNFRVRLVRGGQSFALLASPASQLAAPNTVVSFAPITLQASQAGSGNAAWGGARISGEGNPELEVNGSGQWVTEAIVHSGDSLQVRLTSGAAVSSHSATLVLHSGNTVGTADDASNAGNETTTLAETSATFTVQVLGHIVTASAPAGHGSITPTSQTVSDGGTASFTVTPDAGYYVDSVNGDTCTPVHGSGDSWTVPNITDPCAVAANFAAESLTATGAPNPAEWGQTITLSSAWSGAGSGAGEIITFMEGATTLCTAAMQADGTASCSPTPPLAVGSYIITANYPGDSLNGATSATFALTVNKAAQAITAFAATPANPVYSPGGTFTVSATGGGSGNPVTFASSTSGVCTTGGANGATVTMVSAGSCSITANQAGNANYLAAPDVTIHLRLAVPYIPVPTLGRWALMLLGLLLGGAGLAWRRWRLAGCRVARD
ncbi:MAG TPA: Ig-like domain repeat protein [Rhodanobacteraceae bacterium]|nr:Ig-like domain repeat protein [Rhodanobacteraceae bacterium]